MKNLMLVISFCTSMASYAKAAFPTTADIYIREIAKIGPIVDIDIQEEIETKYPQEKISSLLKVGFFDKELSELSKDPLWVKLEKSADLYEYMTTVCGIFPKDLQTTVSYYLLKFNYDTSLLARVNNDQTVAVPNCKPLRKKLETLK
ncbi:MAG: hypothetical protein HOO06_11355 [Bdellovibrionaceae bacterium]|nr:hypothetical protein [Pseudobdellovibrionaceae bacterium]